MLAKALRAIPFVPRARRLIDETLGDREFELARPTNPVRRLAVAALSLAGLCRALTAAVALDVAAVSVLPLLRRLAIFGGMPALVIVTLLRPSLTPVEELAMPGTILMLRALAVVGSLEMLLPIGFFLAVAWPSTRQLPVIGTAAIAGLSASFLALVAAPAAQFYYNALSADVWNLFHPNGVRFVVPTDFYSGTFIGRSLWLGPFVGQVPFKVGLGVLASALVILGWRIPPARSRLSRLNLVAVCLAVIGGLSLLSMDGVFLKYSIGQATLVNNFTWLCRLVFLLAVAAVALLGMRRLRWYGNVGGVLTMSLLIVSLPADWQDLYALLVAGYAPVILSVIAVVVALGMWPTDVARPAAGELSGPTIDEEPPARSDRHDPPLTFNVPSGTTA